MNHFASNPSDIAVVLIVAIAVGYMLRSLLPTKLLRTQPPKNCGSSSACSTCGACASISKKLSAL